MCNAYMQSQTLGMYDDTIARFAWCNSLLCLWIAIMDLLAYLFAAENITCVIVAGILLCGLGIIVLASELWAPVTNSLFPKDGSSESRVNACLSMLVLRSRCVRDKTRANNFALTAFFIRHTQICKLPHCPITKLILERKHGDPIAHRSEMLETVLFSVNRLMKRLIIDRPRCLLAKMFYVSVIISALKFNYILGWEMHKHVTMLEPNLVERFILYCQKYCPDPL